MRSNRLVYLLLFAGLIRGLPLRGQEWQGTNPTHCVEEVQLQYGRIADSPFLASWKFTGVYRYPDGSVAPGESSGKLARDSSKSSYSEENRPAWPSYTVLPGGGWKKAQTAPISNFLIEDLAKRTVVTWISWNHDAVVSHLLPPKPGIKLAPEWARVPWIPDEACGGPSYTVESLGTRTILGIETMGVRASRPIAGNETRIPGVGTVTMERWYSPELAVTLIFTERDSRIPGENRWEITDIQRVEPPSTLFQVPTGYTLKDSNPVATVSVTK
jgi:hypothetical protein